MTIKRVLDEMQEYKCKQCKQFKYLQFAQGYPYSLIVILHFYTSYYRL